MASMTHPARRTRRAGARPAGSALATSARGVLLGLSALGAVNHALGVLAFAGSSDERMMFTLFAALDLYAVVVLLTAYRRGERWAWALTWVHTAAYAMAFVAVGPGVGSLYLAVAGVAAAAQLAGLPSLRRPAPGDRRRGTPS